MSVTPDLESLLGRHGLYLIGLEVLPRPDGTQVILDDVRQFLRARRVVAGIALGEQYGSPAAVVINLAAFEDDAIAVTTDSGELGRGQDAFAFFGGLAHQLQSQLVVDEEALIDVTGEMRPWSESDEDYGKGSSLSVVSTSSEAITLTTLSSLSDTGFYGGAAGRGVVMPPNPHRLNGALAQGEASVLPLFTFSKSGQLRTVSLHATAQAEPSVLINCGPDYEAVSADREGAAYEVEAGLARIPRIINAELPESAFAQAKKRGSQRLFGRRNAASEPAAAAALAAHGAYDLFTRAAEELAASPANALFANTAMALGYPHELARIITGFDSDSFIPEHYGLAPVAGRSYGTLRAIGLSSAFELCEKIRAKATTRKKAVDVYSRAKRQCRGEVLGYGLLAALALLANILTFTTSFELSAAHRVMSIFIFISMCVGSTLSALTLRALPTAREIYAGLTSHGVATPLTPAQRQQL